MHDWYSLTQSYFSFSDKLVIYEKCSIQMAFCSGSDVSGIVLFFFTLMQKIVRFCDDRLSFYKRDVHVGNKIVFRFFFLLCCTWVSVLSWAALQALCFALLIRSEAKKLILYCLSCLYRSNTLISVADSKPIVSKACLCPSWAQSSCCRSRFCFRAA